MTEFTFGIPDFAVRPVARRVRVLFKQTTVADSDEALLLNEKGGHHEMYLPAEHVRLDLLQPGSRTDDASAKGGTRYFTIATADGNAPDAAWIIDNPSEKLAEISGYYAFDPAQVTIEVDDDGLVKDALTDDVPASKGFLPTGLVPPND